MGLSQLIYTSNLKSNKSSQMSFDLSAKSVHICEHLGLTGRVFANTNQAFAITEGPSHVVRQYYEAVSHDPLVESILLHMDNPIKAREFDDYVVFLNLPDAVVFSEKVRPLIPENSDGALPLRPSVKLRMMIEAYLTEDILHVA